jgi:hypothetical protein
MPHAHQTTYNYADVAHLFSLIGVTPQLVVGGFLYDTVVNAMEPGNNWTDMQDSIGGYFFQNIKWKPEILWGGGTMNHSDDLNNFGVWMPNDFNNIYSSSNSGTLTMVGNGCSALLQDTTDINNIISYIRTTVNNIETGIFPDSGFYVTRIMLNQRNFTQPALFQKISDVIDSIAPLVANGEVVWSHITETRNDWQQHYNSKSFQWTCGWEYNSVNDISIPDFNLKIYPNPLNDILIIENYNTNKNYTIDLYDLQGRKIISSSCNHASQLEIDTHDLVNGIYCLKISDGGKIASHIVVKE